MPRGYDDKRIKLHCTPWTPRPEECTPSESSDQTGRTGGKTNKRGRERDGRGGEKQRDMWWKGSAEDDPRPITSCVMYSTISHDVTYTAGGYVGVRL